MGCPIRRIIQFKEAMRWMDVRIIDSDGTDQTGASSWSWSTDGVCWSPWTSKSEYDRICPNMDTDFYLRALITCSIGKVMADGVLSDCYTVCLDTMNPFLQTFCSSTNLFQPYTGLDCALLLQTQLADSVICMFGIPIYYFQVEPDSESADYTFKEFSLHNVKSVKQIKLMIQDGAMPSSNPKLSDFDFDWETDWNVEVGKTMFTQAFGDNAFPKHNDFIYIPMMKRMWSVNSAYDEKNEGLLWRPTTWKLALVKYNDNTNVGTEGFDSLIDNWLVNGNYDDVFGEKEKNQSDRQTGYSQVQSPSIAHDNQYHSYSDLTMQDVVRSSYTPDSIKIVDKQIYHRSSIVVRNMYESTGEGARVNYQRGYCGEDATIGMVIEIPRNVERMRRDILVIDGLERVWIEKRGGEWRAGSGQKMMIGGLEDGGVYQIVLRWSRKNCVMDMYVWKWVCDREDVPEYMRKNTMYKFDFENPIGHVSDIYNNDLVSSDPVPMYITPYPLRISNIRYYNTYLDDKTMIQECIKYTTDRTDCVMNDLARPIYTGSGYVVK